jgi:hypothetical protein
VLLPLRQPCEAAKDPVQTNPRADNRRPKEVRSWKAEVRTSPYRRRQDSDFGLQHFHHLLVNCVYSCRYRSTHSEATEVSGVPLNRRDPARQSRNRGWSADILVRSNPRPRAGSPNFVNSLCAPACCGQECPRSGPVISSQPANNLGYCSAMNAEKTIRLWLALCFPPFALLPSHFFSHA